MQCADLWPVASIDNHLEVGNLGDVCAQEVLDARAPRWKHAVRVAVHFMVDYLILCAVPAKCVEHVFRDAAHEWVQ